MLTDPHFNAREMFHSVEIDGKPLKIPAITPKLDGNDGATRWPGPAVGAHNSEIYEELLGMSQETVATLRDAGVV